MAILVPNEQHGLEFLSDVNKKEAAGRLNPRRRLFVAPVTSFPTSAGYASL